MIEVTLQLPDDLALRVQRLQRWLPTVLDLSLSGFRTAATETATEVLEFLAGEPTPQAVMTYHVSERAQHRLQRLLALNSAGLLGEDEQLEIDELERIEHTLVQLKISAAEQLRRVN
jgi:hypothetical protein